MDAAATDDGVSGTGEAFGASAARQALMVVVLDALASFVVRRSFAVGYSRLTGRSMPTARDRDAPLRQVLLWTAARAAALAVATVAVDRLVRGRER